MCQLKENKNRKKKMPDGLAKKVDVLNLSS